MTSYWCLRCSYVGTSQDYIENHIMKVHGGSGLEMYSTTSPGAAQTTSAPMFLPGALGLWAQVNLTTTRSSYVKGGGTPGGSIYGKMPAFVVLFLFSLGILIFLGLPGKNGGPPIISDIWPLMAEDCLFFGALFIIGGWLEFSLSQAIKDIPTIKIDAAAAGVNEINAAFVPEKGSPLTSLMSQQKCIFYRATLEQYVHQGKSSAWVPCGVVGGGVPSLLTDGSGYIAVDLIAANINMPTNIFYPHIASGQLVRSAMPEGMSLMMAFGGTPTPSSISKLGITFSKTVGDSFSMFSGDEMRITEVVIPINEPYFVMGRVSDVAGRLNNKPVKVMSYDPGTHMLSVRMESKTKLEGTDNSIAFLAFAFGIALILVGLAFFKIV